MYKIRVVRFDETKWVGEILDWDRNRLGPAVEGVRLTSGEHPEFIAAAEAGANSLLYGWGRDTEQDHIPIWIPDAWISRVAKAIREANSRGGPLDKEVGTVMVLQ